MTEREQLRDRLAALMPWGDVGSFDAVDAILAEIEAAGYVLLERGRAKRLIAGARMARNMCMTKDDGWMCNFPEVLESDLDPLEGGE